jgi:hypothetical protein
MNQSDLLGYEEARAAYAANLSPRYCKLHELEQYVDGSQYACRPHWFDDSKPILERGPHIVEPVVANAIESYSDLILGSNHWPGINSGSEKDDEPFDSRLGLTEEESKTLDRGIKRIEKQAELQVCMTELLEAAMGQSTSVAVCGVRQGKLFVDTVKAKWCEPTFDPDGNLTRLKIQYPYLEQYRDETRENKWAVRAMLFRRIIDAEADTTYKPAPASKDGEPAEHEWAKDPTKTVEHGFGFVPGVWYPHLKGCTAAAEIDGKAIHRLLLDELDALNRGLSQRNRAAVYNGDPQIVEIGVDEGHNPAEKGRKAETIRPYEDESPEVKEKHKRWQMGGGDRTGSNVRKKGPGVVWRYPNPDGNVRVEILALDPKSLDALAADSDDNRDRLAEAMCWVRMDPNTNRGGRGAINLQSVSGKTLMWLYRKQLSRADKIRADFGSGCLLPVLGVLLRITTKVKPDTLYLAGAAEIAKVASKFEQTVAPPAGSDEGPTVRWFAPPLRLDWPPYFEDTEEDHEKLTKRTREDRKAQLITLETAVKQIADIYGIENVEEYVEKLNGEVEEKHEREMAKEAAAVNGLHELAHGGAKTPPGGPGAGNKPPGNAGGGGKPAAPAAPKSAAPAAVSGG